MEAPPEYCFEGFMNDDSDQSSGSCSDDDFDPRFIGMVSIHSINDGEEESANANCNATEPKISFSDLVDPTEYQDYHDNYVL